MEDSQGFTSMAFAGSTGRNQADANLLVKFYYKPRQDAAKTLEEGRPIFTEVEYIDIRIPGDKDGGIGRPATQMDKDRFPEHYAKFKARTDQDVVEGTPLAEWPGVTRAQCEELRYFNVLTVEQLAGLSDTHSQQSMGINVLKRKAAAYLEHAKDNKAVEALEKAQEQIAALMARLEALEGQEAKPKRKRRTKAEMEAEQE